ncbi:MAG: hypothetical protein DRJ30_00180 [Candidatus Methanomethylicota archaeon]|nr:MAG: hypothetical protein DRJ30_00180 [Candidatus Verstraetearchaeota archaeon]
MHREKTDFIREKLFLGRRDRLIVYVDILNAILDCSGRGGNGWAKFTHVMYRSNLSSKRLKERLLELSYLDLIEWGSLGIKLTEKGLNFLKDFNRAMKIIIQYFK